jgi:hypothetical protein
MFDLLLLQAYAYCERAIQANTAYAEAYNNLGVLYRDEVTTFCLCFRFKTN